MSRPLSYRKSTNFRSLQFSNKFKILKVKEKLPKKIVIMASGRGTNARAIIDYFAGNMQVEVSLVLSNNADAGVLDIAAERGIPTLSFTRKSFYKTEEIINVLTAIQPDLIILAGFMWMIPQNIITTFPHQIINIHPALLPKYGGKGMYGSHVHRAVLAHKERESGITIHYVNEHYDEGKIIARFKTSITSEDDLASLETKIHQLEHAHYAPVIEQLLFS